MSVSNRPARRPSRPPPPSSAHHGTGAVPPNSKTRLENFVRERFRGRRLVVVSNRSPVVHMRNASGAVDVLQPASGLTTAMLPIVEACGGTWVAHGSGSADFDWTDARDGLAWPPESPRFRLRRVRLSSEVERGYYYGLANEALWPLCHVAFTAPTFRHADWAMYREANRTFADAVLEEIGDEPAVVLVNDYHFALLPRMLRNARPDLLIAHFWHIPWPNRQLMRLLPWSEEFLDGLLGSDLLAFHVRSHCHHFLNTIDRGIESVVDYEHDRATRGGHATYVRPFPISIDSRGYAALAELRTLEQALPSLAERIGDSLLFLGVDRLDYTKGIPQRLQIFEGLLDARPDLQGRAVLVQVGAPTRTTIVQYANLAHEVASHVERINARYGRPNWTPVIYLPEHHDRADLAALYRRADVCMVTSLHDGMNLVAKEYVAAHRGLPGTLVLSDFTGAAREMLEACLVNPHDIEGSVAALSASLSLPDSDRTEAMRRLYERLNRHDVFDWARRLFRATDEIRRRREAARFPGN
jgi:trehalose 6-phosphate synthase